LTPLELTVYWTFPLLNPIPHPSRFLSDAELLAQCRVDRYRGSGPGGQKRNKTSNAVRLTHLATKVAVTATESRSLKLNQLLAMRRLRLKLATDLREPIDLSTFKPPDWFLSLRHQGRLKISNRHPLFPATAGLLLDLLQATNARPAAVAARLGVSTSSVIKMLGSDHHVWTAANHIRAATGLGE
jgi:hypothetical protein